MEPHTTKSIANRNLQAPNVDLQTTSQTFLLIRNKAYKMWYMCDKLDKIKIINNLIYGLHKKLESSIEKKYF